MQVSIVNYGEALRHGFRVDAEYWQPEFLRNAALVSPEKRLGDFVVASIPNIKSSPIDRDFDYLEIAHISTTGGGYTTVPVRRGEEPDRAHYILASGDVAVSTVRPNRNAVALVREDGIIGSSGLAALRARPDGLSPHYLFAFCKTGYFVKCLMRASKATMYPAVSNADVLHTPILVPTPPFESVIVELIEALLEAQELAELAYRRAETRLLNELGLSEWTARHRLWFVRYYSELQRAGRMDAEYFQPKYDEIVAAIRDYPGGFTTIRDEFRHGKRTFKADAESVYHYAEIGSVNVSTGEIIPSEMLGADLPANAKYLLERGDVIVSKVRTYLGGVTIVEEEGLVGSGAFCVLQEAGRVNKETLLAFLHSKPLLAWSLKPSTGTSYPVILDDDILNLPIPLLPPETQAQIREQVAESFAMRGEARRRLAAARGAVEIAIEQGEAAALEWLEAGAVPAAAGGGAIPDGRAAG